MYATWLGILVKVAWAHYYKIKARRQLHAEHSMKLEVTEKLREKKMLTGIPQRHQLMVLR